MHENKIKGFMHTDMEFKGASIQENNEKVLNSLGGRSCSLLVYSGAFY